MKQIIFLAFLIFLSSLNANAVCDTATLLAVKVVVLSDSSGQINAGLTQDFIQQKLDISSQSIGCSAQLKIVEYQKLNNNNFDTYKTCDAKEWGKKYQSKNGYLTIVVPYPNHYSVDRYGTLFYGCTENGNQTINPVTGLTMTDPNRIAPDVLYELGHTYNGQPPLNSQGGLIYANTLKSKRAKITTNTVYTSAQGGSGNTVCWKPKCGAGYGQSPSCGAGYSDKGVQTACGNPLQPNGNTVLQTFYNLNGWGCPSGYVLGASVRTCALER